LKGLIFCRTIQFSRNQTEILSSPTDVGTKNPKILVKGARVAFAFKFISSYNVTMSTAFLF